MFFKIFSPIAILSEIIKDFEHDNFIQMQLICPCSAGQKKQCL